MLPGLARRRHKPFTRIARASSVFEYHFVAAGTKTPDAVDRNRWNLTELPLTEILATATQSAAMVLMRIMLQSKHSGILS
jgi:hypothetical protein